MLIFGALALIVSLVIANGSVISHSKLTILKKGQSAAAVLMYDEDGNAQWVDEAWPGSITDNPEDVYYTNPNTYVPETYYPYDPYSSNGYTPSDSVPYDSASYEPTYYSMYEPVYYDYSSGSRYNTSQVYWPSSYYVPPPPPPPPPPQPWYVQALPGVGNVAQTIVQGIAPQTRPIQRVSCSISASPSSVPFGGSAIVQWVSGGAQWADLTDLGNVNPSGSWRYDGLMRTTMFTLNVSGAGGAATCSTIVTVLPRW